MKVRKFENYRSFSCSLYVVSEGNDNFIVDPGFFNNEIKSYIEKIGGISFILLTHGHFDHIEGLDQIMKEYKNIKAYAYFEEENLIYNARLNCSSSMKISFVPSSKIEFLGEGKQKINNTEVEVIHTPGHTRGSVLYYFEKDNILFTGDTLIGPSIGRSDLPTGRESELMDSLNKIKERNFPLETMLYGGHDNNYQYKIIKKYNPYLK